MRVDRAARVIASVTLRTLLRRGFALIAVLAGTLAGGTVAVTNGGAVRQTGAGPAAAGCITETSVGDHTFNCNCNGLRVDARVPSACVRPGCGLILELHGDTGTGLLEDAHVKLRDLGVRDGYIVVAPTGPAIGREELGSTWSSSNDAALVDIVRQFARAYRTDAKRVHVTGFSRGGFVTWRLACDHADLFASAAPAGASTGADRGERTCFAAGRAPSRKIPLLLLMGRTDAAVGYPLIVAIRDAAIANYGTTQSETIAGDSTYTHTRWTSADGAVIEAFDHSYATVADGPWGFARGHCFPGSTTDPYARQYALPCKPPNTFVWGEEVMRFFRAHPMPQG
jgi:poly(3-hydroxybutyrate) depolymerase